MAYVHPLPRERLANSVKPDRADPLSRWRAELRPAIHIPSTVKFKTTSSQLLLLLAADILHHNA